MTSARVKLAVSLLAVIGAIAAGIRYSRPAPPRPPRVPPPVAAGTRTIVSPSVALKPVPPSAAADAMEAPARDPVAVADPPRDLPRPSAMPLEDIVDRAMPGIVMIQTDNTRGSGFLVRPDLVVTNAHVTAGYPMVTVTSKNGVKMQGRVAEFSDDYDLALIQVGRLGPTDAQLPLGTSASLRLGQGIVALGWAQSLQQSTITRGVITGLRQMGDHQMVQTDAAPNPGDSGGPVLDTAGQVVGITTFRFENGTGGLAIPIDDVKPFIDKVWTNLVTSPPAAAPVLVPRPSDAEVRRTAGTQRYSTELAAVANRASALDDAWAQYRAACKITNVPAGSSREWFALYDAASPLHQAAAHCVNALQTLQQEANDIGAAVLASEEAARRADVYPGTRRDLRRRYRLDYAGWDR